VLLITDPGFEPGFSPTGGLPTRGLPAGFAAGADGVVAAAVTGVAVATAIEGLAGVEEMFAAAETDAFSGGGVDVSGVDVSDSALEAYALDVYALVSVADADDPEGFEPAGLLPVGFIPIGLAAPGLEVLVVGVIAAAG
jgi:hypothetical protein